MVIALLGEGKNDYGIEGRHAWEEGAVQPLLRRIENLNEIEIIPIKKSQSRTVTRGRKHPQKVSFLNLGIRNFLAQRTDIKFIIVYKDSDKTTGARASENEAKRKHVEVYTEIKNELEIFYNEFQIKGIPMIPIRMLENWLLGDEDAYISVWGKRPENPRLPSSPEFIWGDEQEGNSNHPKNFITRVLNQYGEDYNTENFIRISENINIQNLKRTCQYSFNIFYNDVIELITN